MILIDNSFIGYVLTNLDLNILQTCSSTNDVAIKNAKKDCQKAHHICPTYKLKDEVEIIINGNQ